MLSVSVDILAKNFPSWLHLNTDNVTVEYVQTPGGHSQSVGTSENETESENIS